MPLFSSQMRRAPGTFKVRKEGGVFGSIIGLLAGLAMVVFGSPLAAWYAESQHRAEDFTTAVVVEDPAAVQEGYVVIEGEVKNVDTLLCPIDPNATAAEVGESAGGAAAAETTNCAYVKTDTQKYTRTEKEQCGSVSDNQKIIQRVQDQCDSDGTNCESCYIVEQFDWKTTSTVHNAARMMLGGYTVKASEKSNLIGSTEMTVYEFPESATKPLENDLRYQYEYLESDQKLLVAGNAEKGMMTQAYEGKPYVFSNLSYQGTLEELQSQDQAAKWGLRIASLVMMVLGFVLIAGPLTMFTNLFRIIPGLGKHLDKGFDALIGMVAGLIGFVLWLVVWGVVLVVKNVWVLLAVLIILGVVVFVLVQRGKKRGAGNTPSAGSTPPSAPTAAA